MTMNRVVATFLACSLLICGAFTLALGQQPDEQEETAPAFPSESTVPRWEYKAMEHALGHPQPDRLQEMGAHGWELVDVVPVTEDGHTKQLIYHFKRPK